MESLSTSADDVLIAKIVDEGAKDLVWLFNEGAGGTAREISGRAISVVATAQA